MTVRIAPLAGPPSPKTLADLSALRLAVFRAWPYLYEGDQSYEAEYLGTFAAAADAVIVCAYDVEQLVGAATASPLSGHTEAFIPLFERHGFDPGAIFYCGESVLLPAYRGQGIGHAFFDYREDHARRLNQRGARFRFATFCAVVRSGDDPRRPPAYRPLDAFWQKRGYRPIDGMTGTYHWREVGAEDETPHTMQFWLGQL